MTVAPDASPRSSLTEIVQANAIGSNTCRILVTTPPGRGVIFVRAGEVVDAAYGSLAGEEAFHALVNAEVVRTQVSTGLTSSSRRIHAGWQALITQAMTLRFEGRLPVPVFPEDRAGVEATSVLAREDSTAGPAPVPAAAPAPSAAAKDGSARQEGVPAAAQAPRGPARPAPRTAVAARAHPRSPAVPMAIGLLVVTAAGGSIFVARRGGEPASAAGSPPPVESRVEGIPVPIVVEASDLKKEQGGVLPTLLSGPAPKSPNPESALLPTIVCRLLIAEDGSVKEAKVFRSRLDQAAFEDAAIAAVKEWRFHPGRRGETPVSVWINWPVSFQQ